MIIIFSYWTKRQLVGLWRTSVSARGWQRKVIVDNQRRAGEVDVCYIIKGKISEADYMSDYITADSQ